MTAIAAGREHAAPFTHPAWRPRTTLLAAGWLALAQLAGGGSMFAASLLRARGLTLEDFGTYALGVTLATMFGILADFGLAVMLVRDLSRPGADARRCLQTGLALTAAFALLAAIGVVGAGLAVTRDASFLPLASVLALNVLLVGLAIAPNAYLRSMGRTSIEAASKLLTGGVLIALTASIVATGAGPEAYAWALCAGSALGLLAPYAATFRAIGAFAPRVDFAVAKRLLTDSAPLGLAMLCTGVYYYADSLILSVMRSKQELAQYNAAYVAVWGYALLIPALRTAFMPAQSRGHASQAPLRRVMRTYALVTLVCAAPMFVVGPLLAEPWLRIAYGAEFGGAANALRFLFVTGGVMFLSSYFGSGLLVSGRQRTYLAATGIGATVNVILNVILIPAFGITGAASATLAAESAVCAFFVLRRR